MTLDELNMLLVLNDSKRVLYLEEEIFLRNELVTCYIRALSKHEEWLAPLRAEICSAADISFEVVLYAEYVMRKRWPAAEKYLKKNCNKNLWRVYAEWAKVPLNEQ